MPGRCQDYFMILAISVGGFSPPSAAEIHKCISKDGKVSFSDVACPQDAAGETLDIPRKPASPSPDQGSDLSPYPTAQPPARLDRQRTREPAKEQQPRTNTSLIYQKWLIEERNATIRGAIPPEINRPRAKTRTEIGKD
ncbi:protein of unknown function [Thiocapsa roseopersicina]|uniref:DUF4124 domain-containing protein n=2 Tax=Thiocapsa roseopersicina TaxID=1058 RepID=A0A1H3CPK7_THIRO|nr:protein of unknown function [Thiocapsa roseopersicina]